MAVNTNTKKNNINIELKDVQNEYNINTEDIMKFISSNIMLIIHKNKKRKRKPIKDINEPFYSKTIPVLSIEKFLIRIMKYTEAENNTLIAAYIFIIKLIKKEKYVLSINNVYRLLLGSIVIAKKSLEDLIYKNSYYCQIGGISLEELNNIELSLFTRIDFKVNPEKEEIDNIYKLIKESLNSKITRTTKIIENNDIINCKK